MVVKVDVFTALGLGYLGQFLSHRMNELILVDGKKRGFPGLRVSHGYVIQHLMTDTSPISRTGSEIARRMGVTQQAASKSITELARLGVVAISTAEDRRAKQVRLTPKGWRAVQQARRSRARLEEKLHRYLGPRRYLQAQQALRDCLELLGDVEQIRARRIRQLD